MDSLSTVAAYCLSMVLSEEVWCDIGYPKRPRGGSVFEFFKKEWETELKHGVTREILASFTAAHIVANKIHNNDIDDITNIYFAYNNVEKSLGFNSVADAKAYIKESIRKYIETDPRNWSVVLGDRINIGNLPKEALTARVMVGCVNFTDNLNRMIHVLQHST